MSEHRDEIAEIIEGVERARPRERWALTAADDLIAAGLVVPAGLTAEKLRLLANWIDLVADEREQLGWAEYNGTEVQDDLRAWAAELRETP